MSTENKWITPTLVDIESWPASDLIIEKPHFGAKHQPTVKQSAASGRLFSTVRSSTDTKLLTPEDIASTVFPDSPNCRGII